jgi:hypothetical protein
MNINIINPPTILLEEGTKAVTLESRLFLVTVKHIGFFSLQRVIISRRLTLPWAWQNLNVGWALLCVPQ